MSGSEHATVESASIHQIEHYREVRDRLRNPPNAVADAGIDLKRKPLTPEERLALIAPIVPAKTHYTALTLMEVTAQIAALENKILELRQMYGIASAPKITVKNIQRTVAWHYDILLTDMLSTRRVEECKWPRHVAMYLSRRLTPLSFPQIGHKFADRDHTTVMNACKRVKARRDCDPEFNAMLDHLTEYITPTVA